MERVITQSEEENPLSYHFKEEVEKLFDGKKFDDVFMIDGSRHPEIVKKHLGKDVSLETLIILERIWDSREEFDKKLKDPVKQVLSMRIAKRNSFLSVDIFKFKKDFKRRSVMSFFDSEIVQKEMEDITSLQRRSRDNVAFYFTMNKKEKIEHIKLLQTLVDKQEILLCSSFPLG